MIVVLADDLSGAAELAGAAKEFGCHAKVQLEFHADTDAEVVCVDLDTRSLTAAEAARLTTRAARAVAATEPKWIYKKCDSVLRGHVLAEIRAILPATGQSRALLISANPARGRIIRGGDCFIDNRPLHKTAFADDPEHPCRTSRVAELLGGDLTGVETPDAGSEADLDRHASALNIDTLPAGGVEFFQALLRRASPARDPVARIGVTPEQSDTVAGRPSLFVCGSAAAWGKGRQAEGAAHGIAVHPMPQELFAGSDATAHLDQWAAGMAVELRAGRSVMAAIGRTELQASPGPARLAEKLADAVARAIGLAPVARVCAEGGATAAAVARGLGWRSFKVGRQFAGGVVELCPLPSGAPAFVIKVGSYDWPEKIWL